MTKYVVVNSFGKYVAPADETDELVLVDDINEALVLDDDNIQLKDGFSLVPVQVDL